MKQVDDFLNQITMYRLVLYCLIFYLAVSLVFSTVGLLPFGPFALIFSTFFLTFFCWATNRVFSVVFKAPTNLESVYITALILDLIITPASNFSNLPFLFWAAVLGISSKYILAIGKKHLFNPAAMAVFITSVTINQSASWWVGTAYMVIPILLGGVLIARKIRKFSLVLSFLATALTLIVGFSFLKGTPPQIATWRALVDSPILFFALVMLTEPQTTPPTRFLQVLYGVVVGILFSPQLSIGQFYTTPEISLLVGNIFSYLVSPKQKLILKLREKIQLGPDIYDFVFNSTNRLAFLPGQYMEWTLGQKNPDSRGSRRYFTIASSPTEEGISLGVKFYPKSSSFKQTLFALKEGDEIVAAQLSGEFILPKDLSKKFVFIAGGIGITPFRSIIKYLLDTNQKRDVILFYSNKLSSDIVYQQVFDRAQQAGWLKVIYTLTETESVPKNWTGKVGLVDEKMIKQEVPDFQERIFYLSGPHGMVVAFEQTLSKMGVKKSQIKVDYFPGYA